LSDEGSGYYIAQRALKAVVSSFDGRSPQTTLAERICKRLGVAGPSDLPGVIYNSDSEPVEQSPTVAAYSKRTYVAHPRARMSGCRPSHQLLKHGDPGT